MFLFILELLKKTIYSDEKNWYELKSKVKYIEMKKCNDCRISIFIFYFMIELFIPNILQNKMLLQILLRTTNILGSELQEVIFYQYNQ